MDQNRFLTADDPVVWFEEKSVRAQGALRSFEKGISFHWKVLSTIHFRNGTCSLADFNGNSVDQL
jgi:hypothetical protein